MSYSVINKKSEVLFEGNDVPRRLEGEGRIVFKCDVPMYGNTDLGPRTFICEDTKGKMTTTKNSLSNMPKYTYLYVVSGTDFVAVKKCISRIEQFIKTTIANEEAESYKLRKSSIVDIIQKIKLIRFPLKERRNSFAGIIRG